MNKKTAKSIDEYVEQFPKEVQQLLNQMRLTIRKAAPEAKEKISYGIPAFSMGGDLVYFAAFKKHIGFFPTSSGITAFKKELSGYKQGRGSVQFPYSEPLPIALVGRIVKFRVKESLSKMKKK